MVTGAAIGGDRWGCAGAPPPVVVVVVVVVQGFKGEVLLKDCSVRHATSLSPIQTLPAKDTQKLALICRLKYFKLYLVPNKIVCPFNIAKCDRYVWLY